MDTKKLPITHDLEGNVITVADLPSPNTRRWVANRKAIVVRAISDGLISRDQALARYHMTERELLSWEDGLSADGAEGLKVTRFQRRRETSIEAKKKPVT